MRNKVTQVIDGVEYIFWNGLEKPNDRYAKCCGKYLCTSECKVVIYHGPGHQSKAHCTVKGPHEVHSNEYGEWRENEACTDYFDMPIWLDDDE